MPNTNKAATVRLSKILILTLAVWVAVEASSHAQGIFAYRLIRSALELCIYMVLPSLGLALLLNIYLRQKQNLLEFLNTSTIIGLLGLPTLLYVEYTSFGPLPAWIPVIHTLFIGGGVWAYGRFMHITPSDYVPAINLPKHIPWPAIISILVYGSIIGILFSRYYPLPDPDPYDWIVKYQEFANRQVHISVSGRPLFYFLIYELRTFIHIDLYAVFKYVLPTFTLLVLVPGLLVASTLKSKLAQLLVLLAPLASASTILYLQTSIPQTISLVTLLFIVYHLAYSSYTKQTFWYWLAGISSAGIFFYHESGSIIFLAWLMATLWHYHPPINKFIQKNHLLTFLIGFLILSNAELISPFVKFVIFWLTRIWQFTHLAGNWWFPAHYINVDGNSVGWAGPGGVAKYYIYYVGPFACVVIASLGKKIWQEIPFKAHLQKLLATPAAMTCLIGFVIVFSIAEILPRLLDISFLPERAWLYVHFFLLYVLIVILQYDNESTTSLKPRPWMLLAMLGIALNIAGAIYVNETKKYITPDYKQNSVSWIMANLRPDSIFIAATDTYLLKFHSHANLVYAPAAFFCFHDGQDVNNLIGLLQKNGYAADPLTDESTIYTQAINTYFLHHAKIDVDALIAAINDAKATVQDKRVNPKPVTEKYTIFIYYAKPHQLDPYANRPYTRERNATGTCQEPNFDEYPSLFKKVYDDRGLVKIWHLR